MKTFPWIAAAAGIAAAAYIIMNTPAPQHATGSDTIEDAAGKTARWGSGQRVRGAGGRFVGKVKEGIGSFAGNGQLADEGAGDQVVGAVKSAAGQLAQAAGETLHDLNR